MSFIHPGIVPQWVVMTARANPILMELLGGRFYKRGKVQIDDETNAPIYPYGCYQIRPQGASQAHRGGPTVKVAEIDVFAVMREDFLPSGERLMSFLAPPSPEAGIAGEIYRTFIGVKNPRVSTGNVWGSRYVNDFQSEYQVDDLDVLELGTTVIVEATN